MTIAEMIKLGVKGFKPSDIREINESGIPTDQIIDLAKNGYSTADVKELITLAGESGQSQPGNEEHSEPSGPVVPPENKGAEQDDYKIKYEQQAAEMEKLNSALKEVQNQFASQNLGTEVQEDPRQKLQEIFKSIY